MYLMGNLTGDSSTLRRQVIQNFDLIGCITRVLTQSKQMHKMYARNYIWVANNLCKEHKSLSTEQIKGLCQIFYEFIEYFYNEMNKDDECLNDIVKGLELLAGTSDQDKLDWISGINF